MQIQGLVGGREGGREGGRQREGGRGEGVIMLDKIAFEVYLKVTERVCMYTSFACGEA